MDELEKFREWLYEDRKFTMEGLVDNLKEIDDFERGYYQGKVIMANEIMEYIRNRLKYGDN